MTDQTIRLTGKRLREIQSGLAVLKDKRLPNAEAESLVASLWQLLRPAFEARDATVEKLQVRIREMQKMEDGDEKDAEVEGIEAMSRGIEEYVHEVKKPKTVISPATMPKAYKGEMGQMNTQGNAAVIIALAPEFYHDPNAAADEKDDDGTAEEPATE